MFKKIAFFLVVISLFSVKAYAWPTPFPSSRQIASQDILPASSDSHSVGQTSNFFRNGYMRNVYLPYRAEVPTNVTSMGTVFASTDGNLYFRNAAGNTEKITAL